MRRAGDVTVQVVHTREDRLKFFLQQCITVFSTQVLPKSKMAIMWQRVDTGQKGA